MSIFLSNIMQHSRFLLRGELCLRNISGKTTDGEANLDVQAQVAIHKFSGITQSMLHVLDLDPAQTMWFCLFQYLRDGAVR